MPISFKALEFGSSYDRPFLAKLWGYKSSKAIERGVVTPANTKYIILFVTKEKQESLPQYKDYIDGNQLFWEGEDGHSADNRILESKEHHDEIHLFYRDTHHTSFIYFGKVSLIEFQRRENVPSQAVFRIEQLSVDTNPFNEVRDLAGAYKVLDKTEQEQIVMSRLGQGNFRKGVIQLWGSCAITGLQNITLLRASHIKPWRDSDNRERLNPFNGLLLIPNYDLLLDVGLITFKNDGHMIVSERLDGFERKVLEVDSELRLRHTFAGNKQFLEYHRDSVFR
jgi:putative restriction endonuclease